MFDYQMQRNIASLFFLLILFSQVSARPFQKNSEAIDFVSDISYKFGDQISFTGKISPLLDIHQAILFIQTSPVNTSSIPLVLNAQQEFFYRLDLSTDPITPFSTIHYWIEIQHNDGTSQLSPIKAFRYLDNRNIWMTKSSYPFIIHWQGDSSQLGQTVLPIVQQSLQAIQTVLPVPDLTDIDIFIYNSPGDLREAIPINQSDWMAAHVDPESQVMLISITDPPDQIIQMKRQIPHELMHLILWKISPDAYDQIPVWLKEGLATTVELSPEAEYYTILQNAVNTNSLIPFSELCTSFPQDIGSVYLSYAQSASFTRYLIQNYGSQKLLDLIHSFNNNSDCLTPIKLTYGMGLDELSQNWIKDQFGVVSISHALNAFTPWLVVLLLVLITPVLLFATFSNHPIPSQDEK